MTKTAEDQKLRDSVARILVNYGILERERASMEFNHLVGIVTALLPEAQVESDVQEMLRKAVRWYFQANPFPEAVLTSAARALWNRSLYGWLYDKVLAILGEADIPEIVSFNFAYHDETKAILPKLHRTKSETDIERIVLEAQEVKPEHRGKKKEFMAGKGGRRSRSPID